MSIVSNVCIILSYICRLLQLLQDKLFRNTPVATIVLMQLKVQCRRISSLFGNR